MADDFCPTQKIQMVNIDLIYIESVFNEKRLEELAECFKDDKCRVKTFESIPMLFRTECIPPSKEVQRFFKKEDTELSPKFGNCCPKINRGDNIRLVAVEGGRFIVPDGNHRIKTLKNQGIKRVLAIVESPYEKCEDQVDDTFK